MTRRADDAARAALDLYAGESRWTRFHVHGRWRSCPFPELERRAPARGAVLDVGCGFGLFSTYLALRSPDRRVHGVDIDERKIAIARRATERLDGGRASVSFELAGADLPPGPYDAVTIVDVLYLLGPEAGGALLDEAASRLAPGGVLLVKEIDRSPAWKYRLSRIQELAATRLVRITAGDEVDFAPPQVYADRLRRQGLTVTCTPLDRGSIHPHHLVEARLDAG